MSRPAPENRPAPDRTALIEISWEVCQQVGGIYQVLRSKAQSMVERWGEEYLLVGPRIPGSVELELETEAPAGWVASVVEELESEGVAWAYGRWLVSGRPRALLLDFALPPDRIEFVRHRLHRDHGVVPVRGNQLIDDAIGFGEGVRLLLRACAKVSQRGVPGAPERVLAHFHEWLGSIGLPLIHSEGLGLRTVFTTHATSVGRYVASSGEDLYERFLQMDSDREANRFGIETQHGVERVCARMADVFTTVSPITGEECERLLGRAPDIVTPNGLNLARFDRGHDFQTDHASYKDQIHRFVMGHFFPSYSFDLENTLYLFNAGRFEPRNKGFDLCLEAMARLNAELRLAKSELTVVFFIVTSRPTRSLEPDTLESRGLLDDLEEVSQRIGRGAAERYFRSAAAGIEANLDDLIDDYWRLRHKRLQHAFRRDRLPPLCTHVLEDGEQDAVLAHLAHLGLRNAREDRVKVVYHPEFISPVNPLWGMDYEHFVRGCHLGVFPSTYEPWGYTPLECIAMGVPAITSDLAGFGRYVDEAFPDHDDWGLAVLPRRSRSYHDAAADLTERLVAFSRLDRPARVDLRNRVEAHSGAFDWSQLVLAYHDAHDRSLDASLARSSG
ncbi:MAG: glycosyltransferase [Myxococcota bacterium]